MDAASNVGVQRFVIDRFHDTAIVTVNSKQFSIQNLAKSKSRLARGEVSQTLETNSSAATEQSFPRHNLNPHT
jgi:hypothetical protein